MSVNKTRWSDVTEAELAASGKLKRGSVRSAKALAEINDELNKLDWQPSLKRATMPQVKSKYRNVKTVVDGIRFDSKRESDYWMGLRARERAGEITELRRQVRFPLYCPDLDGNANGTCLQVAEYVADFTYVWKGQAYVVDAKGLKTQMYRLKKKWLARQQGIEIVEV